MTRTVHRFTFEPHVSVEEVEQTLHLALYGAEGLHGAARVRLEARYVVDEKTRTFVVDATTHVGQTVAQLFAGFVLKEYGEDSFHVERVLREEPEAAPGARPAEAAR